MLARRALLLRLVKFFSAALLFALSFILIDFIIDIRPSTVQSSYRFILPETPLDQPVLLQQDNLTVLVIKRSDIMLRSLGNKLDSLQDPASERSRQPEYARNSARSRDSRYFVSYANGTDLGCLLTQQEPGILREICGTARYDFAGRALKSENRFQNLAVPDYNFSADYKTLTINP